MPVRSVTPEGIVDLTGALVRKEFCAHQLSLSIETLCKNASCGQRS